MGPDRYGAGVPTYEGADGALLHYDVLGDPSAPPVIVLAGGAARDPAYLGDLAGLSQRWQLVVPHLRGVGRSSAALDGERGSFWRQADDLERLRGHLGLSACVLVGHSAGTRLAISYMAQYGDRVGRTVLVTPPAAHLVDVPSDVEALAAARHGEPAVDAALAALQAGPDTSSEETFNAWQQASAAAGYAGWGPVEQAHARLGRWHLQAARAYFSVPAPNDLPDRLAKVEAPVLVVAGARDCLTGLAPVLALANLFSSGTVAVVKECGHYPWIEQPSDFRRAVDPFLDHLR